MTTRFTNELYYPDGSAGEIKTVTTWNVWDCKEGQWANSPPVVLRNILLAGLHPFLLMAIGEIEKTDTDPNLLNPFVPNNYPKQYLDLASNSRTHGRFTFNQNPIGSYYYGEDWKRIIYGSIVHTGCKKLIYKDIYYLVVDDENRDENGDYMDDPVNNYHWFTGDSHAKASAELMELLGLPRDKDGVINHIGGFVDVRKPIQFRAAFFGKWVGKGTIAHNPVLDITYDGSIIQGLEEEAKIDLVIPLSSLKGNKPKLGVHKGKILMGLVFEAEKRKAKPGWMLFQWFNFEVLQKDKIIERMIKKAEELNQAYNNIIRLAEVLRIEQEDAEAELDEGDEIQSIAEYENTMVRIIRADKKGVLLLHPYVVRRVKERMQSVWLNLAKSAGVRFFSVMTQPDESLAHYHVVLPNGRIQGRKVFCAPDFQPGEYIVFCNPMRHWGDCQLWENRHEGDFVNSQGIMAAPRLLLLSLGRDTDGDFVQLIKSSAYPAMREAIARFDESPVVEKLPKVPLKGDLREVAIGSMNDLTGVVASLLGRARGAGVEYHILEIPNLQGQKEERRIIDFLSQELQIAVDSIKSAYPNNTAGLDAVKVFLDMIEAEIPWLSDFKNPDCYKNRPCEVIPEAMDTISRLVKTVNSYWTAPDLQVASKPRNYRDVLFNDVSVDDFQMDYAMNIRKLYRQQIAQAVRWKDENEGDTTQIRQVAESTKAMKPIILETKGKNGELFSTESWVASFWRVAHEADTGDAGLVFMLFADEIIDALTDIQGKSADMIIAYGCQHGKWVTPGWRWEGQTVQVRAYILNLSGKQYLSLEMRSSQATNLVGFHHLGIIGEKYRGKVAIGETKTMRIFTTKMKNNLMSEATLFDPDVYTDDDIQNVLDPQWWVKQ